MTPKEIVERITADENCDFIEHCKDCPLVLPCNVTEEGIQQTANAYLLGYEQCEKDNDWQPIETAPKDGTKILVCHYPSHYYSPVTGSFSTFHMNAQGKRCWRDEQGYKINPTHWKPLPTPPKEEK